MKKTALRQMMFGAVIAAAYVALTFVSQALGLAYGAVQIRLSELLCVLPIYSPAAIWGLTLGCFISNMFSSLGPIDMLCGTAATLLAAVGTYLLRKVKPRIVPLLCPILFNAVIIGAEIAFLSGGKGFWLNAALIALGQSISVLLGGGILCKILDKNNIFERLQ